MARPPCCPRSFKGGKSPAVEESGRLLRGLDRSSVASIDMLLLLLLLKACASSASASTSAETDDWFARRLVAIAAGRTRQHWLPITLVDEVTKDVDHSISWQDHLQPKRLVQHRPVGSAAHHTCTGTCSSICIICCADTCLRMAGYVQQCSSSMPCSDISSEAQSLGRGCSIVRISGQHISSQTVVYSSGSTLGAMRRA